MRQGRLGASAFSSSLVFIFLTPITKDISKHWTRPAMAAVTDATPKKKIERKGKEKTIMPNLLFKLKDWQHFKRSDLIMPLRR